MCWSSSVKLFVVYRTTLRVGMIPEWVAREKQNRLRVVWYEIVPWAARVEGAALIDQSWGIGGVMARRFARASHLLSRARATAVATLFVQEV